MKNIRTNQKIKKKTLNRNEKNIRTNRNGARIVQLWLTILSRTSQHNNSVALAWHDIVVLQYRDSESDQLHMCTKCWAV